MQRILFVLVALLAVLIGIGLFLFFRPQPTQGASSTNPAEGARFALGPADAKVTVVEFANYLCSHCADHAAEAMPRIKAEYIDTGKIRYVFRDLPFSGQETVIRAGEAAACANDSNLYYQYHEVLFRSQRQWATLSGDVLDGYLADLGGQIGMAPATLTECIKSGNKRAGVLEDQQAATRLGVTGTPAFFVNGTSYTGARTYEAWKDLLDKALAGETEPATTGESTPKPSNP